MAEKPPSWRQYDAPGDEPGEKIQPENPEPKSTSTPPSIGEAPFVPYGDPHASSKSSVPPLIAASAAAGRSVGLIVGIVAGVAGVAVAAGVGIFFLADGDGVDLGGGRPDMHSQAGIDELIADLEDDGAGTELYDLTLYPDYAVAYVSVPGGSGFRYQGYYYDGSLDGDWSSGSNTTEKTFDLSEIDGSLLDGLCETVSAEVEDPGDCYIIVDPSETDDSFYTAYASNEFSESAHINFDVEGNEVSRYVS